MRTRKKAVRFPHSKVPTARKLGRHRNIAVTANQTGSDTVKHPRAFSSLDLWRENISKLDVEKQKKETLALIYKRTHDRGGRRAA